MKYPLAEKTQAQANENFHVVQLNGAVENTNYLVSIVSSSDTNEAGIRPVSSTNDTKQILNSGQWSYQEVLTDGSGNIEVYAKDKDSIQFFLSEVV